MHRPPTAERMEVVTSSTLSFRLFYCFISYLQYLSFRLLFVINKNNILYSNDYTLLLVLPQKAKRPKCLQKRTKQTSPGKYSVLSTLDTSVQTPLRNRSINTTLIIAVGPSAEVGQ